MVRARHSADGEGAGVGTWQPVQSWGERAPRLQPCPCRGEASTAWARVCPGAELSQARRRRRKAGGTYLGGWGSRRTVAHAQPFLPAPGSDRAGPGSPSGRAASLLLGLSRGGCVSPQLCCTHCHIPPNPCSAGTAVEQHPIICWSPGPPSCCCATPASSQRTGRTGRKGTPPAQGPAHLGLAGHSGQCHFHMPHPRVPPAKWPVGHHGPLYTGQEQSLRSPVLPLASTCCSPPPQKFLQLMGNPHHIPRQLRPRGGMGQVPPGYRALALPASPARALGEQQPCQDEQSQGTAEPQ